MQTHRIPLLALGFCALAVVSGCPTNGDASLDRGAAFARLKSVALDAFGLDESMVDVYGPKRMLEQGDAVAPRFENPSASSVARSIDRSTWFFWIDLAPDAAWQHPVVYAFVDAESGDVELVGAYDEPRVNGRDVARTDDKDDPTFLFGRARRAPARLRILPDADDLDAAMDKIGLRSLGEAGTECCSGYAAIIVEMNYEHEGYQANSPAMKEKLLSRGYAVTHVKRSSQDPAAETAAIHGALDAVIASSRAQGAPLCQVVFFYDGHGSNNAPFIYTATDPPGFLSAKDVAIKLADVNACEVSVIVHSCFSGNWLLPGDFGFVPWFRDRAPCKRLAMYTSSNAEEFTYGTKGAASPYMTSLFERMAATPEGRPLNLADSPAFDVPAFSLATATQVYNLFTSVFGGDAKFQTTQSPQIGAFRPDDRCAPCCPTTLCGRLPNGFVDDLEPATEYISESIDPMSDIDLSQYGFPQAPAGLTDLGLGVGSYAPVQGSPAWGGAFGEGLFDLVSIDGSSSVHIFGINNDCDAIGEVVYATDTTVSNPYVLRLPNTGAGSGFKVRQRSQPAEVTIISRLAGDTKARANDISDTRVVVGTSFSASSVGHAFFWRDGQTTALSTGDSGGRCAANAIDRDGSRIVGSEGLTPTAVVWSGDNYATRQTLPPLETGQFAVANDVAGDRIAGAAFVSSAAAYQPVVWVGSNAPTNLNTLGAAAGNASAISPSGIAVGLLRFGTQLRGFVWSAGSGAVLLDDRLEANAGIAVLNALAINRRGQILAVAADTTGAQRYVILTPKD